METPAQTKARIGAITAGMSTSPTRPSAMIALSPLAATAAPTTPPIRAWEEEEGSPKYHVATFQEIAPIRPANTVVVVFEPDSTMPLATTAATLIDRNAPAKFSSAAAVTATRGGRARVEIDVATTLAVSWNPLVKSNASAVAMTSTMMMSLCTARPRSAVLDHDALEGVRDGLARVDRRLEALVDVFPAQHDHGIDAIVEQGRHGLPGHPVAVVLQPVDLHREGADVGEVAQAGHGLLDLPRALQEDVGQPLGLLHRRLDLVQAEVVGHLLGQIDDVVQPGGQLDDVLALDRRDERLIEPADDVVGDAIALVLAHEDVPGPLARLRVVAQHLVEQVGRANVVRGRLLEEVEELALLGSEDARQPGHEGGSLDPATGGDVRLQPGSEALQFGGVDRVDVLGAREGAGAHVGGVLAHGGDHVALEVGEALGEAGREALVDAQQVVEDQDLAVGRRAGADADHGDLHVGHELLDHRRRDGLEDDGEAARLLDGEGIASHVERSLGRAALGPVAAER